jgi:hypothetical protein
MWRPRGADAFCLPARPTTQEGDERANPTGPHQESHHGKHLPTIIEPPTAPAALPLSMPVMLERPGGEPSILDESGSKPIFILTPGVVKPQSAAIGIRGERSARWRSSLETT